MGHQPRTPGKEITTGLEGTGAPYKAKDVNMERIRGCSMPF